MPKLRHSLLAGHAIASLLVLALAAGMCGSADVASVHTAHGRDVEGAPSRALSCVSVVPPVTDGRLAVAPEATLPARAATPVLDAGALVAAAGLVADAATDPPRFLLHSALLI